MSLPWTHTLRPTSSFFIYISQIPVPDIHFSVRPNTKLKKMLQLKLLALTLIWWSCINLDYAAAATRDTRLINSGCSPFNASNTRSFFANVNDSISELRGEISNQSLHFGTFKKSRGDVNTYTMFQCRNYLSKNDCLACFNNASIQIRDICKIANGARVIYNDCFLRYVYISTRYIFGLLNLH